MCAFFIPTLGWRIAESQTDTGAFFAESRMAAVIEQEVLLVDINGGVKGVVHGWKAR